MILSNLASTHTVSKRFFQLQTFALPLHFRCYGCLFYHTTVFQSLQCGHRIPKQPHPVLLARSSIFLPYDESPLGRKLLSPLLNKTTAAGNTATVVPWFRLKVQMEKAAAKSIPKPVSAAIFWFRPRYTRWSLYSCPFHHIAILHTVSVCRPLRNTRFSSPCFYRYILLPRNRSACRSYRNCSP